MLVARDEIRQGNQDALPVFHQLMMALSVTFSHEAAHGFTRFLSYLLGIQQGTCTPSSVNFNPNSGFLPHAPRQTKKPKKAGEAGRVFEFLTFGGTIDIESLPDTGSQSSDSTDPFDGTCVVIRYSADDKSKTRKVEDEVIASFMAAPEGGFTCGSFTLSTCFEATNQGLIRQTSPSRTCCQRARHVS